MNKVALWFAILAASSAARSSGEPPVFVETYEEAMSSEADRVLIVFGAEWCSHCKDLARDMPSMDLDGWVVCKVDAGKRRELVREHKLRSFPTSIVVRKGEELSRMVGYERKSYEAWVDSNRPE